MPKCAIQSVFIVFLFMLVASAGEIHDAAKVNDFDAVQALIEGNADAVKSKDSERRTVLHVAARYGDRNLVEYLISKKADVHARCYNDFTPLHLTRDPEVAKVLIQNGAKIDSKSAFGTPLEDAVSDQNQPMVDLLIQLGAKADFELLVRMGQTKRIAETLREKPWMAKLPRKPLHDACSQGNLELVNLLLNHGADPNCDYEFSNISGIFTPLTSAALSGHTDIVKLLCEHGATVDTSGGKNFDSLLHQIISSGNVAMVQLLLHNGANVHSRKHYDAMTPLHLASARGQLEIAKLLIAHHANVNAKTRSGVTPVSMAARASHGEVADLLIEHGATLDIYGASALGRIEVVRKLLIQDPKRANVACGVFQSKPIHWAANYGHADLVEFLLDQGADINAVVRNDPTFWCPSQAMEVGNTPLHVAAKNNYREVVNLLIDRGANVNLRNKDGYSPLNAVSHLDFIDTIRAMFTAGARIEWTDTDIRTFCSATGNRKALDLFLKQRPTQAALDAAVGCTTDPSIAQSLIQHGAKPDIYCAATLGLVQRVKELLDENPKLVNQVQEDYPRETPVFHAASYGRTKLIRLLVKHGATLMPTSRTSALNAAAKNGHLETSLSLIKMGAKVNHKSYNGETALHEAAGAGHLEIVRALLDRDAEVETCDIYRKTPLMRAARSGESDTVRLLLERGASVKVADRYGYTALHEAAESGNVATAKILLEYGSDLAAKSHRGETAVDCAKSMIGDWRREEVDMQPMVDFLTSER